MTAGRAKVATWKRELVDDLVKKFDEYPAVGILDISGIPASQLQRMRSLLRDRAEIKVSRRVLLRISIEKASKKMPELKELADHLEGQIALIFTEMDPFRLWKILEENKALAPAKPGMKAPKDITIPAGETDLPPGPIIGDLQRLGAKARIQAGKITILEDSTIVKEGETISEEAASILSKFGIKPREIGFDLLAAYEDGVVYPGGALVVDEEETLDQIQKAFGNSVALSYEVGYPTSWNVKLMISRSSLEARSLALNASIFSRDLMPTFLSNVATKMIALASVVGSRNPEALGEDLKTIAHAPEPKPTEKVEEKPKEEPKKEEEEEKEVGLGGLFE